MCSKHFQDWLTNTNFTWKNSFNEEFFYSTHGSEVTFFLEKFRSLDIISKMLEIYIKCYERLTWGQNFWIKPTFLPEFKVYVPGLSPLPLQNPYSKLIFGIIVLFVIQFSKFLLYILRQNLWLNTGKKYFIICKQKIIQENAFSEASFRTLIFFASQILIIISTNKAILPYVCDSRDQVSR